MPQKAKEVFPVADRKGLDGIHLFDGNAMPVKITRITVDYFWAAKIKPDEVPEGMYSEYITREYTEKLVIDRQTGSIEYIQLKGPGCVVFRRYLVEDGVERLLDALSEADLFRNIKGNPPDVIETPLEVKLYRITIEYTSDQQRVIIGTFDKNGLPEDWPDFAEAVFDIMMTCGLGEILSPFNYDKRKRCKDELIFCSVVFNHYDDKSYYYITDDDSIEVGDRVVVPVGSDNQPVEAEVVKVEYFKEEDAPYPVKKTKRIIRKL